MEFSSGHRDPSVTSNLNRTTGQPVKYETNGIPTKNIRNVFVKYSVFCALVKPYIKLRKPWKITNNYFYKTISKRVELSIPWAQRGRYSSFGRNKCVPASGRRRFGTRGTPRVYERPVHKWYTHTPVAGTRVWRRRGDGDDGRTQRFILYESPSKKTK